MVLTEMARACTYYHDIRDMPFIRIAVMMIKMMTICYREPHAVNPVFFFVCAVCVGRMSMCMCKCLGQRLPTEDLSTLPHCLMRELVKLVWMTLKVQNDEPATFVSKCISEASVFHSLQHSICCSYACSCGSLR